MILDRSPTENVIPRVSSALEVILMGDDNSVSLEESSNASMKVFTGKEDSETNDEDSVKEIGYSETAKARTITDAANNTLASSRDISSQEGAQILLSMRKAVHSLKDLTGKRESESNDEDPDNLIGRMIYNSNETTKTRETTADEANNTLVSSRDTSAGSDSDDVQAQIEEEKLILDRLETSGTFQPKIGLRRSPRRVLLNIPSIQLNDELIGDFIWGSNEIKQTLKWQEKESSCIKTKKTENSKMFKPLHRDKQVYTDDDETFSLYTDIDKLHLNDVHILIRQDILEGYVVSIKHDRNSRPCHIQRYANTVGFRCKWCKHKSLNDRPKLASVYPRRIGCIYSSVVRFQRLHIM